MEPTGIILLVVVVMATCTATTLQGNSKNQTANASSTFGSKLNPQQQVDTETGPSSPEASPTDDTELGKVDADVTKYSEKSGIGQQQPQMSPPWLMTNDNINITDMELFEQFLRLITANPAAADRSEFLATDQSRDQHPSSELTVVDGHTDSSAPSLTAENMASVDQRHNSWLMPANDIGHPRSKRDLFRTREFLLRLPSSSRLSASTELSNNINNVETNWLQNEPNLIDNYEYDSIPDADIEGSKVDEKRHGAGKMRKFEPETDRQYDGFEDGGDSRFEQVRAGTRRQPLSKYRLSRSFYEDDSETDGDAVYQHNEDRRPRPQVKKPRQLQPTKQQFETARRKVHSQRYQQQPATPVTRPQASSLSAVYDYSLYIPLTYKGAPGIFVPLVTGNGGSSRRRRWSTSRMASGQGSRPDSAHSRRLQDSVGVDRGMASKNRRKNKQKTLEAASKADMSSKKMERMVDAWTQMTQRQVRKALDEYDSVNQMAERIRSISAVARHDDPVSSRNARWNYRYRE